MNAKIIRGSNFSGRSTYLLEKAMKEEGVYVHPDLELNFSGLATTDLGERFLHKLPNAGRARAIRSLSGGEKVRLILDCALSQPSRHLAIDCALEQLDQSSRSTALSRLYARASDCNVLVADNSDLGFDANAWEKIDFQPSERSASFNALLDTFGQDLRATGEAPRIRAEDLWFRYPGGGANIFYDTSFVLEPGVLYRLKAPNGAGKSTLARLLLGVLKPSSGSLSFEKVDLARSRSPMFYAFQNPRDQIFGLSPTQYLKETERLGFRGEFGWKSHWQGEHDLAERFGLADFVDTEIWDLPPIALKRLGLAAAFAGGSPWLFFDEPALGLDANGKAGLAHLLDATAKTGRGVIVVSHGDEFDSLRGSKLLTIDQGRLLMKVEE